MNFAEILKELREERNLTQAEVARKCNVSCQCISSLEMGSRNPTGSTLKALADFFNVSTDYLLGRTDDLENLPMNVTMSLSAEDEEILDRYHSLRPDLKDAFWIALRAMSSPIEGKSKAQKKKI